MISLVVLQQRKKNVTLYKLIIPNFKRSKDRLWVQNQLFRLPKSSLLLNKRWLKMMVARETNWLKRWRQISKSKEMSSTPSSRNYSCTTKRVKMNAWNRSLYTKRSTLIIRIRSKRPTPRSVLWYKEWPFSKSMDRKQLPQLANIKKRNNEFNNSF